MKIFNPISILAKRARVDQGLSIMDAAKKGLVSENFVDKLESGSKSISTVDAQHYLRTLGLKHVDQNEIYNYFGLSAFNQNGKRKPEYIKGSLSIHFKKETQNNEMLTAPFAAQIKLDISETIHSLKSSGQKGISYEPSNPYGIEDLFILVRGVVEYPLTIADQFDYGKIKVLIEPIDEGALSLYSSEIAYVAQREVEKIDLQELSLMITSDLLDVVNG